MAIISPQPRLRAFDESGGPLAGGKLFTYLAGTTTKQATYTDSTGDVPNSNPVILDSEGYADVWLGSAKYKYVLKDADDNTLWTVDNLDGTGSGGNATAAWATHAFTDGQAATDLAGETVDFSVNKAAIYDVQITRGSGVWTGTVVVQNVSGTGRAVSGMFQSNEGDHGLTFDVDQTGTVATLTLAASSGPGDGSLNLSRRLIPA